MKIMTKGLALLLAAVLLLGALPTAAFAQDEAITYALPEVADQVKLIGRTEVTDEAIVPHTTASGIAFYSDCSGDIEMEIYGDRNYFYRQYFIVYVDGEIANRVTLEHGVPRHKVTKTLTMAEDLEPGMHRIEIYRETEEVDAYCEWRSITLNGELIPVPEAPMLIEFVGDSITTGFGAYPFEYQQGNQTSDRQAGTKSYAFLTAAELGMDIQKICTSGYGAEVGYNADGVNMQDMYEYTAYHHDHSTEDTKWSFERPADIVVINMGTNDNGASKQKGVKESQVLAGMKNLMEMARRNNPDAKIVWCTGMMGITFKSGIEGIVEELGGADNGYYFCVLPMNTSGGGGHPDEQGHRDAAETLTQFLLDEVLPADYADSYVTAEEMETLLAGADGLEATVAAVAKAELDASVASGNTYSGTMTAMYEQVETALADQARAEEAANDQQVLSIVIVVAVLIVGAAVIVAVAVLYKPKKKEDPMSKT